MKNWLGQTVATPWLLTQAPGTSQIIRERYLVAGFDQTTNPSNSVMPSLTAAVGVNNSAVGTSPTA